MFDARARVLEKLNADSKDKKQTAVKEYKESKELGESEVLVTIEHW